MSTLFLLLLNLTISLYFVFQDLAYKQRIIPNDTLAFMLSSVMISQLSHLEKIKSIIITKLEKKSCVEFISNYFKHYLEMKTMQFS